MIKIDLLSTDPTQLKNILGEFDKNLKALKAYFRVNILIVKDKIILETDDIELSETIKKVFSILDELSSLRITLRERDVTYISSLINLMD